MINFLEFKESKYSHHSLWLLSLDKVDQQSNLLKVKFNNFYVFPHSTMYDALNKYAPMAAARLKRKAVKATVKPSQKVAAKSAKKAARPARRRGRKKS